MFVKLLSDVNGLYILWVSAEMAYNFYNISAGCPMQIDFNLKHCLKSHLQSSKDITSPMSETCKIRTGQVKFQDCKPDWAC